MLAYTAMTGGPLGRFVETLFIKEGLDFEVWGGFWRLAAIDFQLFLSKFPTEIKSLQHWQESQKGQTNTVH